jgi:hypothetical protein
MGASVGEHRRFRKLNSDPVFRLTPAQIATWFVCQDKEWAIASFTRLHTTGGMGRVKVLEKPSQSDQSCSRKVLFPIPPRTCLRYM